MSSRASVISLQKLSAGTVDTQALRVSEGDDDTKYQEMSDARRTNRAPVPGIYNSTESNRGIGGKITTT